MILLWVSIAPGQWKKPGSIFLNSARRTFFATDFNILKMTEMIKRHNGVVNMHIFISHIISSVHFGSSDSLCIPETFQPSLMLTTLQSQLWQKKLIINKVF